MFWNLVRYEFKNVNKWYLALYGAVLALSVLIGAQASSLKSIDTPNQQMIMLVFRSGFWRTNHYLEYFNLDFDHPSLQGKCL